MADVALGEANATDGSPVAGAPTAATRGGSDGPPLFKAESTEVTLVVSAIVVAFDSALSFSTALLMFPSAEIAASLSDPFAAAAAAAFGGSGEPAMMEMQWQLLDLRYNLQSGLSTVSASSKATPRGKHQDYLAMVNL
jgi:hypothetical protein